MAESTQAEDDDAQTETETDAEADTEGEPTGADPDGTTDVATDETETVDAPDDSGFSAIVEASVIQDAIDSVSVLVDECKMRLNEEDFAIRAVDPANVGMVDLSLAASAFESYQGNGGVIGVNLGRFEDIASMANSGDLIHMELDQETRKLHIEFDGLSYTLALIDPDSIRQEPDIPDLDLSAELVAEGSQLDRGITAADMVSDHIRFRVDADAETFHIEAEGDTDDVDLEVDSEELIDLTPGEADSLYSLDYLKDMNKALPNSGEVTAELGVEFPVKLHYELAEGLGQVTYMLAPRITDD
jgi:proliferating cell nuclear antigen